MNPKRPVALRPHVTVGLPFRDGTCWLPFTPFHQLCLHYNQLVDDIKWCIQPYLFTAEIAENTEENRLWN
jgi:hypothetical protein